MVSAERVGRIKPMGRTREECILVDKSGGGQMDKIAFTAIVVGDREMQAFGFKKRGYGIGLATRNIRGYAPRPTFGRFGSLRKAEKKATNLNWQHGIDGKTAARIVLSTLRLEKP